MGQNPGVGSIALLLPVLGTAAAVAAVGAVIWAIHAASAARWKTWVEVGQRLGLAREDRGWLKADALVGYLDRVEVVVDTFARSYGNSAQSFTRVVARAIDVPPDLQVGREHVLSGLVKRAFTGADVEIGDPPFDDAALVRGPEDHLLAVLDADTRQRILARLGDPKAVVKDGQVELVQSGVCRKGEVLEGWIVAVRDQARDLALAPEAIPPALARNAHQDPVAGVRARNLEVLARRHPAHPDCAAALERALEDPDLSVRVVAASQLRSPSCTWEDLLGAGAAERLTALLAHGSARTQALAAAALGELGGLGQVEPLSELARAAGTASVVKQAARAAIQAIQERSGSARPGGLTVAEQPLDTGGGLALAGPGLEGRLAVADEPTEDEARPSADRRLPEGG